MNETRAFTKSCEVLGGIFGIPAAGVCMQTRSVRAMGSCALNLCGVACGRLDFTYEIGFGGCWDCAAGALVIEEAGGVVLDPSGAPFNVMSRRVLAGNKFVANDAARVLASQPLGPTEPPPL